MIKSSIKKISIAMTAYNGERFIEKQLQSILDQTRRADEVVIIDDCSTDKTPVIVKKFIEKNRLKNWVFYINESNLGYIKNFYQAIGKTTGDLIFLCDQDDIWHADKIEKMVRIFEDIENIRILNTGFVKIDAEGKPIVTKKRRGRSNNNIIKMPIPFGHTKKVDLDYIIWRNISPGCTAAFTKDLRDFCLKNRTFLCPHDWEINIFGAVFEGLYFCNESLVDYRIHSENTIGIADLTPAERMASGNKDPRFDSAEMEYKRACAYLDSSWHGTLITSGKKALIKYKSITELRSRMVREKKLHLWVLLLSHFIYYDKLRGLQGIFNDLIYIIKRSDQRSQP
jgi:glycosyltransferase involved in cell wall biosynthesis